ncbi:MAG: hypothetical protein ABH821_00340 [archaeon]
MSIISATNSLDYARILRGLASERNTGIKEIKVESAFDEKTVWNIVRLFQTNTVITGKRIKNKMVTCHIRYPCWDYFIDRVNYAFPLVLGIKNQDELHYILWHSKLDFLFDVIEIYCFTLIEGTKIFDGSLLKQYLEKVNLFVSDFNNLLAKKEIPYELIKVKNSFHVNKKVSDLIEKEVVQKADILLSDKRFSIANKNYFSARKAFTQRRFEDTMELCNATLESTLLAILDKNKGVLGKLLQDYFVNYPQQKIQERLKIWIGLISSLASNETDKHGGKKSLTEKEQEIFAEFCVGLTGSLIIIITKNSKL